MSFVELYADRVGDSAIVYPDPRNKGTGCVVVVLPSITRSGQLHGKSGPKHVVLTREPSATRADVPLFEGDKDIKDWTCICRMAGCIHRDVVEELRIRGKLKPQAQSQGARVIALRCLVLRAAVLT